jgi:hypothetical protein
MCVGVWFVADSLSFIVDVWDVYQMQMKKGYFWNHSIVGQVDRMEWEKLVIMPLTFQWQKARVSHSSSPTPQDFETMI